ncbi:ATP-binding protein, partial [Campylobacter troglodytis]|uniref:ATP-binding protein n=1 Tax=Campylobacter troglodytis TaxID=654363 RepID=UPI00115A91F6
MSLVSLSTQELAFLELKQALVYKEKQNGLILLVGKSGLGKSLLLKRLCKDKEAILFERAFFNEDALLRGLFEEAFKDGLRAKNHNLKEALSKENADLFASTFKQEAFKQDKANKLTQQSQNGKNSNQISQNALTQQNSNQISQNKFKPQDQKDKENKGSFKSKQMQDKSSHTTKCVNFLKQERSKYEFDFSTQAKDNKFKPQSQNDNNQISQNKLKQQDQNNQIPHNKFKPQDQITRGLNSHQKFKPNKE